MKSVFASAAVLLAVVLFACSDNNPAAPVDPDAPITSCDPSKCAEGNTCLELDGDVKCRKSCASNTDPATSCPTSYTCVGANEPTELPATGCTKVADKTQSRAICAAYSTASGTRLTAYTCADGVTPLHGCVGDGAGHFCCDDNATEKLAAPLCQKDFAPPNPVPGKQWGASCLPTNGIYENPACDSAQGFYCFAPGGPADATAYCTRFDCTSDRECGAGLACQRTNIYPDANHPTTTAASFHKTQNVCAKREYASLCRTDLDCPTIDAQTSHCVTDDQGRNFCSPECTLTSNCHHDAHCQDLGIGPKVCYPNAGVSVGSDLCSPCRSDADCGDDGICYQGDYTEERFCAKHQATPCGAGTMCPAPVKAGPKTACLTVRPPDSSTGDPGYDPGPLLDYCVGFYSFSDSSVFGCYSRAR